MIDADVAEWLVSDLLDREAQIRELRAGDWSLDEDRLLWDELDRRFGEVRQQLLARSSGRRPRPSKNVLRRKLFRLRFWDGEPPMAEAWVSGPSAPQSTADYSIVLLGSGGDVKVVGVREFCFACRGTGQAFGAICEDCQGRRWMDIRGEQPPDSSPVREVRIQEIESFKQQVL